jgi:hypothetical protein
MITTDLKLLVDVAWHNRDGQAPYLLAKGEYAAAERLLKRGLIMNGGGGQVGITSAGEQLIVTLCGRVARGGVRKARGAL